VSLLTKKSKNATKTFNTGVAAPGLRPGAALRHREILGCAIGKFFSHRTFCMHEKKYRSQPMPPFLYLFVDRKTTKHTKPVEKLFSLN
jgi:hypothetical protein